MAEREQDPEFEEIWARVKPYTMTSPERGKALYDAVRYTVRAGIPGAIVECGVWKGGSSMLIALTLMKLGQSRPLYLFDTFEGMTPPGEFDKDLRGTDAQSLMDGAQGEEVAELVKARAGLEGVRAAMQSTGYDMGLVRFIKGDVAKTLPQTNTLRIALLRLDTDFYDSTLAELRQLYPRLARGGTMIVDDYGHWQGARRAFHDYFDDPDVPFSQPLVWPIDYTGVGCIKQDAAEAVEIARYDYVPPGMTPPDLLPLFPYAAEKDPWQIKWPYLRPEAPHRWRSDTRDRTGYVTGNASVEEAACLHAVARQFKGQRALEIGSHYGWTAAHILSAGVHLDCIDPEFNDLQRLADVKAVLDQVPTSGSYRLWGGFSPDLVPEVSASGSGRYSFVFIDGSHDGDNPRNDALAVQPHLAKHAVVMFHDLTSPFVERGLYAMKMAGFKTRLFNTMQVLGVAWRGRVEIPDHKADPNVPGIYHPHLAKYSR